MRNLLARALERARLWWPGLLLAVFLFGTFATMPFFRAYWQDDVQIVDWGRVIAHPESDWAVTWNVRDHRPTFLISHLGILLQYQCARIFEGPVGARLSGVVGGLFAFAVIVGLFRQLGWGRTVVWLLGLVFLLDPHFCASFRGGRVDSWAIGFMLLAACLYIRGLERARLALLAGTSAAFALMIWPSAVLLLPLVFALAYGRADRPWGPAAPLRPAISFGAGFAATLVLLLATHPRLRASATDLVELTESVTMVKGLSPGQCVSAVVSVIHAYGKHVLVPLLSLLSVAYLLSRRRFLLPIAYLLAFAVVAATSAYGNRILYLAPLHMVCLGTSLLIARSALSRRILTGVFVFLLVWNSLFSVVLRPIEAVRVKEARAPQLLDEPFAAAVGPGAYRVYGPWEIYFPGRKLGWRSYCDIRRGTLEEAISQIDFDFAFVQGDDPDTLRSFVQRGYQEVPGWTPPTYRGKTFLLLKRG